MNYQIKRLGLAITIALAGATTMTLSGCGGGGGGGGGGDGGGSGALGSGTDVTLSGVVADGLIQGAKVCYDLNDNGICDSGEPVSTDTGADGKYNLKVPLAEAGKHNVLALVPVGAVDSDTGAVTKPYSLKAPPQSDTNKSVFVSPITTIVAEVMAAAGTKDPAAAIEQVKVQLGMTASPLDNFIAQKSSSDPAVAADAVRTGNIAQVVTTVKQEVGSTAAAAGVSPASTEALISVVVINNLANLADKVANQTSTTSNADIGLQIVASQGITTATVAGQAAVAVAITTATIDTTTSASPTPFVTLRDFRYTNSANWSYRLFSGNDVADSAGNKYVNDVRKSVVAGTDVPYNRNAAYFNAATATWYSCPSDGYLTIQYKDATAAASASSLFCRTYASTSMRTSESIAGSTIASVVERIRASGLPGYDTWGPAASALTNGSATFPAGSVLRYQISTDTSTPDGQVLGANIGDRVRVNKNNASDFNAWPLAASLDEMAQYYPGSFAGALPNGGNTDGMGQIPDATVTDPSLQKFKNYRIAFQSTSATAGNVRFYLCRRNAAPPAGNGFTNCNAPNGQVLFDSTYTIETKGDARVMRFASVPADLEAYRKNRRLYVERAGAVFYGFKDILQTTTTIRLNQAAWDALRAQTPGVTAHTDPAPPIAVDAASWLRDIRRSTNAQGSATTSIRVINSVGSTSGTFSEVRVNFVGQGTTTFARNNLYWTGTAWTASDAPNNQCASNGVNLGTYSSNPRSSNFCGLFTDTSSGFDADISGKLITTTLADMRLFGSYDNGNDFSNYGPLVQPSDPLYSAFVNAVFPSGSRLRYQVVTTGQSADNFNFTNPIVLNNITQTTLGSLTAVFNGGFVGTASGSNTLGIYNYNTSSTPAAGTTVQKRIRVSLQAGNANFYSCGQDSSTGFTVNCTLLSTTTYTIADQGGKNVMRFAALPAVMTVQGGFERAFVEHNGAVYPMGKGVTGAKSYTQRLNQVAYEAMFNIFGVTIPAQTPVAP